MAPLPGPAIITPPAALPAAEEKEKGGEEAGDEFALSRASLTAYLSDPEAAEKAGFVWVEGFDPVGV